MISLPYPALDLIPHQAPMVFVDQITAFDAQSIETSLKIRPDLLFCEQVGLPTWVSIEIMAQTISCYAGLQGAKQQQAPKIGFLLGSRKLQLPCAYFALGETLQIRAEQQFVHEGLGQFQCEIFYRQHVLSAVLSVYEPSDAERAKL
ncbi:ApeP family dehydratase [Acinetobacter larvae]|uniref:3-hydroxylacyl-ACP dehydratase n=1 Tax=Acinetobacter larvae TaxID=1789224 RepID=A0A1B2M269_9GAMM|nr:3-hydroxylacyl-ACP dehydratase [Acinetobacter larvae]AOA59284.1 3-hydroxylacyl-ACP dehydratase [Acinetobacter larvae]